MADGDGGLTWLEMADAVWLAALARDGLGPGSGPGRGDHGGPHPPVPAAVPDGGPSAGPPPTGACAQERPAPAPAAFVPGPVPADAEARGEADGTGGGAEAGFLRPPRPPDTPALPGSLGLARALRPLRRTTPSSSGGLELDEEATAEAAAVRDLWLPVTRPVRERYWDAVLVVDESPAIGVWEGTIREIRALLEHQGPFRTVRTVRLDTPARGPGRDHGRGRRAHGPAGTPGREIVLVVTDGLGPAWRDGRMAGQLHRWGGTRTVAVLHLLPHRLWRYGAAPVRWASLVSDRGSVANRLLSWSWKERPGAAPPGEGEREGPGGGFTTPPGSAPVPVPVLELNDRWLRRWAGFVGGGGSGPARADLPVVLAVPGQPRLVPGPRPPAAPPVPPQERIRMLRTIGSPSAFRLATRLAAVPLSLPVMRAVHGLGSPPTRPEHVGEILAAGLIQVLGASDDRPSAAGSGTGDGARFEFAEGVRELLLAHGMRSETEETVHAVDRLLGHEDRWVRFLSRIAHGEDVPTPDVDAGDLTGVSVAESVLTALSGRHARRAKSLRIIRLSAEAEADALRSGMPVPMVVAAPDRKSVV